MHENGSKLVIIIRLQSLLTIWY